jgi:hypothetical protein
LMSRAVVKVEPGTSNGTNFCSADKSFGQIANMKLTATHHTFEQRSMLPLLYLTFWLTF